MSDNEELPDAPRKKKKSRREGTFLLGLAWKEKVKRPGKKPLVQVHFYWKKIFILLGVLAFVGWFVGAGVLYFYFKERRNYEEVSYFKMLILPLRVDDHRKEMGEYFIDRGIEEIEAGNFRSGFHMLRSGLARSPGNPEARILLARIFHSPGFGDNRLAIESLREGLRFSDQDSKFLEVEYLSLLFMLMSEEERDEERIALASDLMEKVKDPMVRALLVLQSAQAEAELGRYGDAVARLKANRMISSPPGMLLLGNILRGAGRDRQALATFERGVEMYPDNARLLEALYSLMIENESWNELLNHANYRRIVQPDNFRVWTARLAALQGMGEEDQVTAAVYTVLNKFPTQEVGFELLRFAVENRRLDVAEIVLEDLRESGSLTPPHAALMGLAYLRGKQPRQALAFLDEVDESDLELEPSRAASMRAMAYMMLNDQEAAIPQFQQFIDSDQMPDSAYATLGKFYLEEGLDEAAYRIFQVGVKKFPSNREILQEVMTFDLQQSGGKAYAAHAGALVDGRVPSVTVLEEVQGNLLSDRFLFAPQREEILEAIDSVLAQREALTGSAAVTTSMERTLDFEATTQNREFMKLQ